MLSFKKSCFSKLLMRPSSVGRGPVSAFDARLSCAVMAVRPPSSVGSDPAMSVS